MTLRTSGAPWSLETPAGPLVPRVFGFQNKESRLCSLRATQRSSRQSISLLIFFARCFFTLVALSCFFFAVDSWLHAAPFLLFADLYSLLASCWSVLSSRCLIIISLSSPLTVIWKLYIIDACCSLLPNSLLTMSLADCCTQTVDCCPLLGFHYSFLATSLGR